MSVNIKMPKWDLSMKEAKITRWFKKEGDMVDKGEDLFEVETKKITQKVQSSAGRTIVPNYDPGWYKGAGESRRCHLGGTGRIIA